ncbi:hypothetical protein BsIDN1_54860 [Bacillus safensis]|uniref:Phage terminase large subunit C-terminal domain-containing protein n=1 Tax=Bacillus safensis TaxID=561879 RepID=A0A5S9MFQ2_BACIA|nr:hypothetical protein BsIDN1_54860 [Bacillus safensis]
MKKKNLYIYWEYYDRGKTDDETATDLQEFIESQELIKADAAEPKTIHYFRQRGFQMVAAHKFQGSRLQYTKKKTNGLRKLFVLMLVHIPSMNFNH